MDDETNMHRSPLHSLFVDDDLRPALMLATGQVILAFLSAVLITTSLPL